MYVGVEVVGLVLSAQFFLAHLTEGEASLYGIYISQLIRFARVCSHVEDLNVRNKCLTAKLIKQGYRYHKLNKAFSNFYRRHHELVSKFNVGVISLSHKCISKPEFYGDLRVVYKFKRIIGRADFSDQFRKIIIRHKCIGYDLNVMRQYARLVINPITVDNFAHFNCPPVDRASDSMMAPALSYSSLVLFRLLIGPSGLK